MTDAPASIFLPEFEDLTENERAWLGFLRLITKDADPAPTLARVQALRSVFSDCHLSCEYIVWKAPD
jgi:hypothetical protein